MNWAKKIFVVFLCIFTVAIPISVFVVKFANQTFIGHKLKLSFIRHPFLVKSLNLNEPGDARFIYLDPKSPRLTVSVFHQEKTQPSSQIFAWITQMIQTTLEKKVEVNIVSQPISASTDTLTNMDLNQIRQNAYANSDHKSDLLVIYIPLYAESPSFAGVTLHRDTIFIFQQRIQELTPITSGQVGLEKSTLLHEWGHLLGMEHNTIPNCIMSALVEVSNSVRIAYQINTEYCWNELYDFRQFNSQD